MIPCKWGEMGVKDTKCQLLERMEQKHVRILTNAAVTSFGKEEVSYRKLHIAIISEQASYLTAWIVIAAAIVLIVGLHLKYIREGDRLKGQFTEYK